MKTPLVLALCLLALTVLAESNSQIIERGAQYRIIESQQNVTTARGVESSAGYYVELGDGMHYWDGAGWKESEATFEVRPDGAVASKLQYKLRVGLDLSEDGVIDYTSPEGKRFKSNPAFLAYRDSTTGQAAIISQIKPSEAKTWGPNAIIFEDAFQDVVGTIRISVRPDGMEQDVILYGPFPMPAEFGLDETHAIQLEMWTLFSQAPNLESFNIVPADDLEDMTLNFGDLKIGQGKAFQLGEHLDEMPVAKRWGPVANQNGTWLVEIVSMQKAGPILQNLQAALNVPPKKRVARAFKQPANDSELAAQFDRSVLVKPKKSTRNMTAAVDFRDRVGFLIDYSTISAGLADMLFKSDTTYYITAPITLTGTTTFEGGTVIKFAPTNSPKITVTGGIVCKSSHYRPILMTGRDDHTVGEKIGSSNLSGYYGITALYIDASTATQGAKVDHLIVRNAGTAITILGRTDHVFSHVMFADCGAGIKVGASVAYQLRNALFANVVTNFTGASSSTARIEHLTADTAQYFNFSSGLAVNLTNSILAGMGTLGTLAVTQNVAVLGSPSGLFQRVANGKHYLASGKYRNAGTPNVSVLSDLKERTTYPPLPLSSAITFDTILSRQVPRDTDLPDYGYHYPSLDYCVSNAVLSASLFLTNGVALGVHADTGFLLLSGAKIIGEGFPHRLNRIVRTHAVQESGDSWGLGGTYAGLLQMTNTPAIRPEISIRHTEVAMMADTGSRRLFLDTISSGTGKASPAYIRFRDSFLAGIGLVMTPDTADTGITSSNSVLLRPIYSISEGSSAPFVPMNVVFQNSFIFGGTLALSHKVNSGAHIWAIYDNLFDTVTTLGGTVNIPNSHNAYKSTAVWAGTSGSNLTLTSTDFQTGALGEFYCPTAGTQLNTLRNAGKQANSGLVGLFHHTTTTDQVKDSGQLDIGFHYIATGGSGSSIPKDSDGDGISDTSEDWDGDGVVDTGETNWNGYNSFFGLSGSPGLEVFSPLKF